MAPEQFEGHRVTEKVDVFAFAVLCWEMLTSTKPWNDASSPMQVPVTADVQSCHIASSARLCRGHHDPMQVSMYACRHEALLPTSHRRLMPFGLQIIYMVGVLKRRLPIPRQAPRIMRQLIEACWHQEPIMRPSFEDILPKLQVGRILLLTVLRITGNGAAACILPTQSIASMGIY